MMIRDSQRVIADQFEDAVVVRFRDTKILDEETASEVSKTLFSLVEDGHRKLLIDFTGVQHFTSMALGLLIKLNRQVVQSDGLLVICNTIPDLRRMLAKTKLDKLLKIVDTEHVGLETLRAHVGKLPKVFREY